MLVNPVAQNRRAIHNIHGRLFVNVSETMEYLMALVSIVIGYTAKNVDQRIARQAWENILLVRRRFWKLPADKRFSICTTSIEHTELPVIEVCFFGSCEGEVEIGCHAWDLGILLYDSCVMGPKEEAKKKAVYLSALLNTMLYNTQTPKMGTWTNVLTHALSTGDEHRVSLFLCRLATMASQLVFITPIPFSRWTKEGHEILNDFDDHKVYKLPVPDHLTSRVTALVDRLSQELVDRHQPLDTLISEFIATREKYNEKYANMWLDMMVSPRRGLRDGWLDSATINLPGMRDIGYKLLSLNPEGVFPNFAARYLIESYGGRNSVQISLQPSDLQSVGFTNDPRLRAMDQIMAFVAVSTMWRIVMAEPTRGSENGDGTRDVSGSIVRPFFRRLPQGFQASNEARARARQTFRTEPLPGFTFVKEHQRGENPQSGTPLFAIESEDFQV